MSPARRERPRPLTYLEAHLAVKAARGKASDYPRAECGDPARDWAYQHEGEPEAFSETGAPYSTDVNAYAPMCRGCHERYDNDRTPEVREARVRGSRISAAALAERRRADTPEGARLRETSRENARSWAAKTKLRRAADPEFDAEQHARLSAQGRRLAAETLGKTWSNPGPRGSTKTNQMRRCCVTCGKTSTPGPLALHLLKTGHREAIDA